MKAEKNQKINKYHTLNGKNYVRFSFLVKNRGACINYFDRGRYQTLPEEILIWIDYEHRNEYMIIPASYIFDFGSIPTWARWISEKDEYCAYLPHDRFFDRDCKVFIQDKNNISPKFQKLQKMGIMKESISVDTEFLYNRKFADSFMYQLIKEENREILRIKKPIKEYLVYLACRVGGGKNFRKRNYFKS